MQQDKHKRFSAYYILFLEKIIYHNIIIIINYILLKNIYLQVQMHYDKFYFFFLYSFSK